VAKRFSERQIYFWRLRRTFLTYDLNSPLRGLPPLDPAYLFFRYVQWMRRCIRQLLLALLQTLARGNVLPRFVNWLNPRAHLSYFGVFSSLFFNDLFLAFLRKSPSTLLNSHVPHRRVSVDSTKARRYYWRSSATTFQLQIPNSTGHFPHNRSHFSSVDL